MPGPIKFSVVIPVFNRANLIVECVDSVLAQDFERVEVVVVDDGSTDGTVDALSVFAADNRVRVIRQRNKGAAAARNAGILAASGTHIAFLDSDDRFLPGKLSAVHRVLEAEPLLWVYHQAVVDRGGGVQAVRPSRPLDQDESLGAYFFRSREFIPTMALVIPTEVCRAVMYDEELKNGDDVEFLLRVDRVLPNKVFIPELLGYWRDDSTSGRLSAGRSPELALTLRKKIEPNLKPDERKCFEATVISYELGLEQPLLAAWYVARGFAVGKLPPSLAFRSLLRAILPGAFYRRIVDAALKVARPAARDVAVPVQ